MNNKNNKNKQLEGKVRKLRIFTAVLALTTAGATAYILNKNGVFGGKEDKNTTIETKYVPENPMSDKDYIIYSTEEGQKITSAANLRVIDKAGNIVKNIRIHYTVENEDKTRIGVSENPVDIWNAQNVVGVEYNSIYYTFEEFKKEFSLIKMDVVETKEQPVTKVDTEKTSVITEVDQFTSGEDVIDAPVNPVATLNYDEFNKMVSKFECYLANREVSYTHEDVLKTAIYLNLMTLNNGKNDEVCDKLFIAAGNPTYNELAEAYFRIYNAINDEDYKKNLGSNFTKRKNGYAFCELTSFGGLIASESQSEQFNYFFDKLSKMDYITDLAELDKAIVEYYEEINKAKEDGKITTDTLFALDVAHYDAGWMLWSDNCANFLVLCQTPESLEAATNIYSKDTTSYGMLINNDSYTEMYDAYNGYVGNKTLVRK